MLTVLTLKPYNECFGLAQMIMVREPGDPTPNTVEYRHGLTPPMKDARKRRFRREPDLNVNLHLFLVYYQHVHCLRYYLLHYKKKSSVNPW